ncbi:zf-HC2 domain-containing protein, partial [Promicromonospora kroppenstedtii]|uniref:zf-HC2 domain-containing protein n=1 Tax=Promicromonospora kroppenstedtii TaxID=440482 RepID=UPI0012F823B3
MTVTSADLSLWAAHRRAVVFTVSRRVPGVDPELAASCGLELLCVELLKQGDLADPLAFWSTAAVEVAMRMTQEGEPGGGPAGEPAALAPVRHALDFEVLNLAMERLPAGEQQLLWDHHVVSRPVSAIADEIGVLPYAAKRRLRRAENRLASTFATAHAGTTADLECRSTRAALHDFVRNRLLPRRRQQVEDHMVGCSGCTRAFVDVRESYWMLRAGAPVLLLGTVTAESGLASGAAAAGAAAGGA